MTAYWVARSKVNDPVEYKKYTDQVPGIIAKFAPNGVRIDKVRDDLTISLGGTPSVTAIVDSNAPFVMKWGASSFVSKHRAQQYPTFATLSRAIVEQRGCRPRSEHVVDHRQGAWLKLFVQAPA